MFSLKGSNPRESVQAFKQLPESKRHAFELIKGHLANLLINDARQDCLKITVLREPVDRIVSHYYYAKFNKKHYLYLDIHENNLSLKDYIEKNVSPELANYYTRHFSELNSKEALNNADEAIALALKNLRQYDYIGFQDELDDFVNTIAQNANLTKPFKNKRINRAQYRVPVCEINDDTLQVIKNANQLDISLFEKAKCIKS